MSGAVAAAAGGVLWRQDGPDLLVALVHRPRYDDWTLPKGKAHAGEQLLLAAVREVGEETGAQVEVGRRLHPVRYPISSGTKRVAHWTMRYLSGEHRPSDEVDRMCWLTVAEASKRLTYPVDRGVLADFATVPVTGQALLLVRHAKAGKRSAYHGEDRLRPLDKIGRRHAREAAATFATFAPQRVVAADRVRCQQTVAPLAALLDTEIQVLPEFSDEAYLQNPKRARTSLYDLAELPGSSVICSQGTTIPGLLADLRAPGSSYPTRKGSLWVLMLDERRVLSADYYPHPNA